MRNLQLYVSGKGPMQGTRASTVNVLNRFARDIPVAAPDALRQ